MYRALFLLIMLLIGGTAVASAQADKEFPSVGPPSKEDDAPMGMKETLSKMRVEKDKKEFNEMLRRGEDALKLADELDTASANSQRDKIAEIGKLVKKVREDLGGDGDDDDTPPPRNTSDGIKELKQSVRALSDELKSVTRFTISASAIERANEVLRLVKYLRG